MHHDLLFIGLFITCGLCLIPLLEKLHLPWPAALIASGFIGSELVTTYGVDLSLRWHSLRSLFLDLLIPVLIYDAVLKIKIGDLRQHMLAIVLFSLPFTVLTALLSGTILYFFIGHPTGFPLASALTAGALLSITNPIATIKLFSRCPKPLRTIISGESLFNSIVAISLFSFCVSYSIDLQNTSMTQAIHTFGQQLIGALGIGLLSGTLSYLLLRLSNKPNNQTLVSFLVCVSTVYLSNLWLGGAGITAAFISSLLLVYLSDRNDIIKKTAQPRLAPMFLQWNFISYIAAVITFTIMGISITADMFSQQWLAMLIGLFASLLARYVLVHSMGFKLLPAQQRNYMALGGVRGMAVVALAISLPTELTAWWTIQSIAYAVVLFSILLQTPLLSQKIERQSASFANGDRL